MASIGVADRLADPQGEQGLVAGVRQRVDGLREHAGWPSVDPRQEFEEEVQPIAADKRKIECTWASSLKLTCFNALNLM